MVTTTLGLWKYLTPMADPATSPSVPELKGNTTGELKSSGQKNWSPIDAIWARCRIGSSCELHVDSLATIPSILGSDTACCPHRVAPLASLLSLHSTICNGWPAMPPRASTPFSIAGIRFCSPSSPKGVKVYMSLYGVPLTGDDGVVSAVEPPDPVVVGDTVVGVLVDLELPQAEITSATAPSAANTFSRRIPRTERPLTHRLSRPRSLVWSFIENCCPKK